MMRISIVTGVIGAFVVLSVRPAFAEKLTLACTFESGINFDRERDVNQIIFDTDRPQVDLRVAQTMGTNNQSTGFLRIMQNARTASRWCRKAQKSALLLSATGTRSLLVSTGSPEC